MKLLILTLLCGMAAWGQTDGNLTLNTLTLTNAGPFTATFDLKSTPTDQRPPTPGKGFITCWIGKDKLARCINSDGHDATAPAAQPAQKPAKPMHECSGDCMVAPLVGDTVQKPPAAQTEPQSKLGPGGAAGKICDGGCMNSQSTPDAGGGGIVTRNHKRGKLLSIEPACVGTYEDGYVDYEPCSYFKGAD